MMRKAEWGFLGIVALAFATGIAFYAHLPAEIASHWNATGEVNGYMSRAWGTFLFPVILLILAGIFLAIPHIDPKRENIVRFRKYYDYFLIGFGLVFYYIYFLTLLFNVGYHFNFTGFLIPPLATLLYFIGILLPHTELNWSIGIRTPWTISSETVWKKTHAAGGAAFKICGVIALLGVAFPGAAVWLLVAPVVIAALGLVVYSYVLYEKEKH
jgi:uncharacterized membrane protein